MPLDAMCASYGMQSFQPFSMQPAVESVLEGVLPNRAREFIKAVFVFQPSEIEKKIKFEKQDGLPIVCENVTRRAHVQENAFF